MPDDSDVIVVGAGPAGSTAARLLARAGVSVTLIDREKFPRDKCCAGWLNSLALDEFPELASRAGSFVENSFRGIVFHSPDLEQSAEHTEEEPVGCQVRRPVFDAMLVEMAREAGAQVLTGEPVAKVVETEGGASVTTRSGRTLRARVLVAADGAGSFVARSLGMMQEIPAKDMVVCVNEELELGEGRVAGIFGEGRPIHVALAYNFLAGYAWVFPKRSSLAVGLGGRGITGEKARGRYREFFADMQRKGLIPKDAVSAACRGAVEPAGAALKAKTLTGRRTVLVGDAGGFVSAASGEGIYPGMVSAKLAAECVGKALASDDPAPALAGFDAAWRTRLGRYLAMPNVNLAMMMPMIFTDRRVTARFARAFLFGEKF